MRLWGIEIDVLRSAHERPISLVALQSEQLLAALKGLVRREHVAMADMLAHLAELDERRLYLDLGNSSLFMYCREALGFCKSSAGRRIAAARVCGRYPDAFLRLAKGEQQLSVLSALGSYLDASNAADLLDACSGKSFEQVEELLAARFPRPDVRDSIRRLPEFDRSAPIWGVRIGPHGRPCDGALDAAPRRRRLGRFVMCSVTINRARQSVGDKSTCEAERARGYCNAATLLRERFQYFPGDVGDDAVNA